MTNQRLIGFEEKIQDFTSLELVIEAIQSLGKEKSIWLDIEAPTSTCIKLLQTHFQLHPLTMEDIVKNQEAEKIEHYPNYLYLSIHTNFDPNLDDVLPMHILCCKNVFITIQHTKSELFNELVKHVCDLRDSHQEFDKPQTFQINLNDISDDLVNSIQIEPKICLPPPDFILYGVLDIIMDRWMPIGDAVINEVQFCDEIIYTIQGDTDSADIMRRFNRIKRSITSSHNSLVPKLKILKSLSQKVEFKLSDQVLTYLRELEDNLKKTLDKVEFARDNIAQSNSNYLSKIDVHHRRARVVADRFLNAFGVFAIVVLPFHTITGMFGMNIAIPFQLTDSLVPWFVIVAICIVLTAGLCTYAIIENLIFSRRKKYFISQNTDGYDDDTEQLSLEYTVIDFVNKNEKFDSTDEFVKNLDVYLKEKQSLWIDIQKPTETDLKFLETSFGVHPLTIEDCFKNDSGEKCEVFTDYVYVCIRPEVQEKTTIYDLLHIIQLKNCVITIHEEPIKNLEEMINRVKLVYEINDVTQEDKFNYNFEKIELTAINHVIPTDWIMFGIVDYIVDRYMILTDSLANEVEVCDEIIFEKELEDSTEVMTRINRTKKMLSLSHIATVPKRKVIQSLGRSFESKSELLQTNIKITYNHIKKIIEKIEYSREMLNHVKSNYITKIKIKIAESSKNQKVFLGRLVGLGILSVPTAAIGESFRMNVTIPLANFDGLGPFFGVVSGIGLITFFFYAGAGLYLYLEGKKHRYTGLIRAHTKKQKHYKWPLKGFTKRVRGKK
jgi:Mg2+ and Co2+ transporter CorA